MATPTPLTTTSYAILGLLAVKPWTTYELAQQMRRALGQFWPALDVLEAQAHRAETRPTRTLPAPRNDARPRPVHR